MTRKPEITEMGGIRGTNDEVQQSRVEGESNQAAVS